ncbi:MAG: baseplate J/gp47 family protein [Weissella confusa]
MLDNSGFIKRSYSDILAELVSQAQSTISADIATTPDSMVGAFLRVMAYELAKEEELQESVWMNGFVSQASGVSLDRLAANIGLTRNPAQNAIATLTVDGVAGTVIPEQTLFGTENGLNFFAAESVTIPANGEMTDDVQMGQTSLMAVSVDASLKANVPANAINMIIEPIDGLNAVTNATVAEGGVELESDTALRKRLTDNYKKSANGTVNSLITSVENVPGVQLAQVIVNDSMEPDSSGNVPKSVHFYVQGGSDEEVANAILNSVVAGVATNGKVSIDVPLANGTSTHNVKFDRPTQKVVDVIINLNTNAEFSVNGVSDVKNAIQEYLAAMTIGQKLFVSKLYAVIYGVTGIDGATVTVSVGTDSYTDSVSPADFEYIVPGKIVVNA